MKVSLEALLRKVTVAIIADISHLFNPIKAKSYRLFLMSSFDEIHKLEIYNSRL